MLQEDKDNVKAIFRRGKAHSGMGHTEEALRDLQAAAKLAPADKAISREIQAVKATMKRDREGKTTYSSLRVPAITRVDRDTRQNLTR